jgi:hypothetical protein
MRKLMPTPHATLVCFVTESQWNLESPEVLSVSNASAPVNKMHVVAGRLWCTSYCEVYVINPSDLHIEVSAGEGHGASVIVLVRFFRQATFQANPDSKRGMHCIAASGLGVWLAPQGGSTVLLFHATTYQQLLEISIKQAVSQKLQGLQNKIAWGRLMVLYCSIQTLATDDIIRQHKTACLRVTSLLACKDLLWIGTSAGVLLTLPIPKILSNTTKSSLTLPEVSGRHD